MSKALPIRYENYENAFSQEGRCAFGLQERFKNMPYLALVAIPWLLLPSSLSAQACHEPMSWKKPKHTVPCSDEFPNSSPEHQDQKYARYSKIQSKKVSEVRTCEAHMPLWVCKWPGFKHQQGSNSNLFSLAQSLHLAFIWPWIQPQQTLQFRLSFPCGQALQMLQWYLSFPCSQLRHSRHISFRLPCGHAGVQDMHRLLSLPCGQGTHKEHARRSLPWGQLLHLPQFCRRIPWGQPLHFLQESRESPWGQAGGHRPSGQLWQDLPSFLAMPCSQALQMLLCSHWRGTGPLLFFAFTFACLYPGQQWPNPAVKPFDSEEVVAVLGYFCILRIWSPVARTNNLRRSAIIKLRAQTSPLLGG